MKKKRKKNKNVPKISKRIEWMHVVVTLFNAIQCQPEKKKSSVWIAAAIWFSQSHMHAWCVIKVKKKVIDIIAICWNAEMPFCCCRRCFHSSFSLALCFSMFHYRHFRMRFICKFHMNLRSWWCCLLFANSYSHSVLSIAIACIGCELCRRA